MNLFEGLVVTDLDGTLLDSQGQLSDVNRECLLDLARRNVCRVIATGRSLVGARKVLEPNTPIDFLIFSCGAGVLNWRSGEVLRSKSLNGANLSKIFFTLDRLQLSYMIHLPIPENHRFFFRQGVLCPTDLMTRFKRNSQFCEVELPEQASQCLVVVAQDETDHFLKELTPISENFSMIRTTSPLDHHSTWFEIFQQGVDKASACQWLVKNLGLEQVATLAVGNDFNDESMLDWAKDSYVVANAPLALKSKYPQVDSNNQHGFQQAVRFWLP